MEFIAGIFAGISVTLSGHPLDTIKVRMQTGHVHSLSQCISKSYKADGFRGFYYGISSPLCSIPLVNAVVFGSYSQATAYLGNDNTNIWNGVLAGSFAGLVNTIVVTPVELIKCRMQAQSHNSEIGTEMKYKNSIDCVKQILKQQGIRGLYVGNVASIYREIPGYAANFVAYEYAKESYRKLSGKDTVPTWALFVSGMWAGFNCWFWSYPQDVIKTKLQVGFPIERGWDGGFYRMTKLIYKEEGWRGFWVGFSACTIRSTIPNGFGFLAYELAYEIITRHWVREPHLVNH